MFPSRRYNHSLRYYRVDNNIFCPASIAFLLLKYYEQFTPDQQNQVEKIVEGVRANYPFYSGLKEPVVYNFYRTRPNDHFPNGKILRRFKHFILADDADDTVMITMTSKDVSADRISTIRQMLLRFANGTQKWVKGFPAEYSSLKAYSTWFGSGAMPVEFEICVICNVLYFVFKNQLPLTEQDHDSLEFIRKAVSSRDVINRGFHISGQYPKPSVILYHIGRLISILPNPNHFFDVNDLQQFINLELSKQLSTMDKVLLSIALMHTGRKAEAISFDLDDANFKKHLSEYSFFMAPMLSGMTNKLLFYLKQFSMFHLYYSCAAFNYMLLLEYELLRQKHGNS
jgi:hypothetical protein